MQFNTHRINDCSSYDAFSIDFIVSPSLYLYSSPPSHLSIVQKNLEIYYSLEIFTSLGVLRKLFRNREIAFEADAYYHWMHNYSAVPIISIILINQAVSE